MTEKCSHGVRITETCRDCWKVWGIQYQNWSRERRALEALTNARTLVSLYHDDVGQAILAQVNEAIHLLIPADTPNEQEAPNASSLYIQRAEKIAHAIIDKNQTDGDSEETDEELLARAFFRLLRR